LAQVIELLRRRDGATIGDLTAATGWLAHTTRAALTGLRKRGYAVTINRSNKERGSIYCINPASTLEDDAAVARSEDAQAKSMTVPKRAQRRATSNARRAA
jgi:DNA-binding MarR family transcriptional regulator